MAWDAVGETRHSRARGRLPNLLPLVAELRVARPIRRPRTRPDRVRGDKAYSSGQSDSNSAAAASDQRSRNPATSKDTVDGAAPTATGPSPTTRSTTRTRNVIECGFYRLKQWRVGRYRSTPAPVAHRASGLSLEATSKRHATRETNPPRSDGRDRIAQPRTDIHRRCQTPRGTRRPRTPDTDTGKAAGLEAPKRHR